MRRLALLLFSVCCLGACKQEAVQRSDTPLSLPEAAKRLSFPFPASAKDIYFFQHADGTQEFQRFVRFAVDPNDLEPTVAGLLNGHPSVSLVYDPDGIELKPYFPISWWTPRLAARGSYHAGDRPPIYIWTDTEKSLIYVCTTD